jgi:hypothetical protein
VLIVPLCALLPDLVLTYVQLNHFPRPWDPKRQARREPEPEPPPERRRNPVPGAAPRGSLSQQPRSTHTLRQSFAYTTATFEPEHKVAPARPPRPAHGLGAKPSGRTAARGRHHGGPPVDSARASHR